MEEVYIVTKTNEYSKNVIKEAKTHEKAIDAIIKDILILKKALEKDVKSYDRILLSNKMYNWNSYIEVLLVRNKAILDYIEAKIKYIQDNTGKDSFNIEFFGIHMLCVEYNIIMKNICGKVRYKVMHLT